MHLATWNLEHFWHVPDTPLLIRASGVPTRVRGARLIARTCSAVQRLQADLLCVQEIGGARTLQVLCPKAQTFVETRLCPAAADRDRRHGIGFAVRPDLPVRRLPDLPLARVPGADASARDALVLEIAETFLAVGLHLKSGCPTKLRLDKRAPCKVLAAQIEVLCAWMRRQTLPLVLMGDFNRTLGQARDPILKHLQTAASIHLPTPTVGQIDHILAPQDWALTPVRLPRGSSFYGISDHLPICMQSDPLAQLLPPIAESKSVGQADVKGPSAPNKRSPSRLVWADARDPPRLISGVQVGWTGRRKGPSAPN